MAQAVPDHKKGEVNELQALLRNPKIQRDDPKRREVIKKVIAYMTLGIDVSRLFSDMIMACNTKDLVQKKMVYLYLCTYAEQKSDLAILAINTLHKDIRDDDPMIRGLALRSLCSLRLPNIVEYTLPPIRQRLNDQSSYVRKTAVIGCAKIFARHPKQIKESDIVDILYGMLRDKDTQVVSNVVCALNEILADEGQMAINQQIVLHLLNRLHEFNEWNQCDILHLVSRYTPASDQEMFDVMNLLEDRLRHVNSAVVLAATKVFLNFTKDVPNIHQQVYTRLKAPLLTLMGSPSSELAYAVLGHINLLVGRTPNVFADEFKQFFCRYNDIPYVKLLKLNILQMLANEKNFPEIIAELSEYVADVDSEISLKSIRSIGAIALRIVTAADEAIENLLGFLNLNMDYVTTEACIALKDLLRKYPDRYVDVIPALQKVLKNIDEAEGKVAVIWMIGEYGDTIKDAPYILEPLIDSFKDEPSHSVRLELLAAAMKLFFKRPPELQKMLGRLLKSAIDDTTQIDVRDRGLLYYRLLQYDVHEAARVVNSQKISIDSFVENEDRELKEKIFNEFDTLSVIYDMPEKKFVTGVVIDEKEEEAQRKREQQQQATSNTALITENEDEHQESGAPAAAVAQPTAAPQVTKEVDLLSLDSLSFTSGPSAPASKLQLSPQPVIDANTFQNKWGVLPTVANVEAYLQNAAQNASNLEGALARYSIFTMASGSMDTVMKFFLYAENATNSQLYLVELVLDLSDGSVRARVKSEDSQENGSIFAQTLKDTVASL